MGNTQGTTTTVDGDETDQKQHLQALQGDEYDFNYTQNDLELLETKEVDEAYGEIRIYRIKNSGQAHPEDPDQVSEDIQICTKTRIFDSKEDCKDYFNDLEDKKKLVHPHLVRLVKSQTIMNSNFCTNIYKVDMAYEYIKHSLETEILERFKSQLYFDENNIFDLLEQVLSCLYYLGSQGVAHGDIQPRTILIDNYENFRITDIQFLTSGMCGYRKHLTNLETECFLAPELLQKLRRQTILDNDEVNQEKADVFSLGLVALAMSTLQNVDVIYNFDEFTLKEEEIQNLLETVKTNYSHNLYLLLASMLNHVDKRLDFENALNLIDQMRSDQFNQEDYERQRFQTELANSEKKLAQSEYHQQAFEAQNQDQNEEAPKRSKPTGQPQQQQQQPEDNHDHNEQDHLIQQQLLQEQRLQQQLREQQNSAAVTSNPSAAGAAAANQQQINQTPASTQQNLNDIEARVREALMRSQQVSMKFENSPLRQFRDQLLADELYVPLDPQFSSTQNLSKSRNLESSGRKNGGYLQTSQAKLQSQQQSQQLGSYSLKSNQASLKKKQPAGGQQRLLNGKWKI